MNLTGKTLTVIIIALVLSTGAFGESQTEDTEYSIVLPVTLHDVVALAVANYPALKAAGYMEDAARSDIKKAGAMGSPRFDLGASFSATDNPMYSFGAKLNQEKISEMDFSPDLLNDPDVTYNSNYSLSFSYPIYTGGMIQGYVDAARHNADAVSERNEYSRQQLAAKASEVFMGAVFLRERGKVLSKFRDTAIEHRNLAESFVRNGMTVEADLLAAEVYVSLAEREVIDNRGKLLNALQGIRHMTADSVEISIESLPDCVDGCAYESITRELSLDQLIEKAQVDRRELSELKSNIEALGSMKKAKKGESKPRVGIGGQYDLNLEDPLGGGGESFMVMLQVTKNLHDGGALKADMEKLDSQLAAMELMHQEKLSIVKLEVTSAYNDYQSAFETLNVTEKAIAMAEENLRITENRYRNGLINYIELKDAEDTLKMAELHHLGAVYNVQLSLVSLDLATGAMDKYYPADRKENDNESL